MSVCVEDFEKNARLPLKPTMLRSLFRRAKARGSKRTYERFIEDLKHVVHDFVPKTDAMLAEGRAIERDPKLPQNGRDGVFVWRATTLAADTEDAGVWCRKRREKAGDPLIANEAQIIHRYSTHKASMAMPFLSFLRRSEAKIEKILENPASYPPKRPLSLAAGQDSSCQLLFP